MPCRQCISYMPYGSYIPFARMPYSQCISCRPYGSYIPFAFYSMYFLYVSWVIIPFALCLLSMYFLCTMGHRPIGPKTLPHCYYITEVVCPIYPVSYWSMYYCTQGRTLCPIGRTYIFCHMLMIFIAMVTNVAIARLSATSPPYHA